MQLAQQIAYLRNMRIDSSRSNLSNLQGFSILVGKDNIQTVYHVLMPSKKGDKPRIMVGETSYDKIDIDNIKIIGCSSKNPTNFDFTDGNHTYRFTSADSQLLMNFDNKNIVKDTWDVKYADDAYQIFADLADRVYGQLPRPIKGRGLSSLHPNMVFEFVSRSSGPNVHNVFQTMLLT